MKFLTQTRLHKGNLPHERGNCYPTVIACILDLDSPEDVVQFQEHFHTDEWVDIMFNWLLERGYEITGLDSHLFDDTLYFVTGTSPRNTSINHICIYQNGKLLHDPHPDRSGLVDEQYFTVLKKINKIFVS